MLMAFPPGIKLAVVVYSLAFFTVEGILKIIQALRLRPAPHWGSALHSGIVSLLLVVLMFSGLPLEPFWAQGQLAGIDLIFGGLSMVMAAVLMRGALQEGKPYCIGEVCFQN